jgi:hypothetical protein
MVAGPHVYLLLKPARAVHPDEPKEVLFYHLVRLCRESLRGSYGRRSARFNRIGSHATMTPNSRDRSRRFHNFRRNNLKGTFSAHGS